ncbi:unnamed protein product [Phytophthora fragariaefolia]|uniref:Unnamed protein product n=1 Tax=Phytophthora fragariaefolia TaxID=1490495 RepID=A0A9W6XWX9_9STRA|nr:unnamed protein product [Phytophthora fragariaefolia]
MVFAATPPYHPPDKYPIENESDSDDEICGIGAMPIASLAPANSKKASLMVINSFIVFFEAEDMTLDKAHELIVGDGTGRILRIMIDKYAYSLARLTNKARLTNTCLAYFGNVKNWQLDMYPQHGTIVKPLLQKVLSELGKFCSNREEGAFEKKVPPCSKQDLEKIVRLRYTSPSATSIYLDASLVVMMWYLYGRSSDAEQPEKQQLSVLPGKSHQQLCSVLGPISLMFSCPIRGSTLPPIQEGEDSFITRYFVVQGPNMRLNLPSIYLSCCPHYANSSQQAILPSDSYHEAKGYKRERSVPGAQASVDRLPVTVNEAAQKKHIRRTSALTPHSFRRGVAMHANDGTLAENWIIERGGWQLDRVNKAFGCTLVGRMREIIAALSIGEAEVLAWSATIRRAFIPLPEASSPSGCSCDASAVLQLIKRQSEPIEVLILQNKRLEDRQLDLEAQLRTQLDIPSISEQPSGASTTQPAATPTASQVQPTIRLKKKSSQSLSAVWYE